MSKAIITESYFDGYKYHNHGPYKISIENGYISGIEDYREVSVGKDFISTFIMPGMTEAHCHLFLKGEEMSPEKRADHLRSAFNEKVKTALDNLQAHKKSGITFVCDAGDSFGINKHIQSLADIQVPGIRQAEMGVGKSGHYGRFIARQGSSLKDFDGFIKKVSQSADVLKIVLSGIIDFEKGQVKDKPQFSLDEMNYLVAKAADFGLSTMTHCSGREGLDIAIEAGVDSIEHGFFMSKELLRKMRDKEISWVPTFSPVHFQYANPHYSGWSKEVVANLKAILDKHKENLLYGKKIGVSILVGSDAGSFGVSHGKGFIDELFLLHEAGIPTSDLLNWATVKPREIWNLESNSISEGNKADFLLLDGNPFDNFEIMKNKKKNISDF